MRHTDIGQHLYNKESEDIDFGHTCWKHDGKRRQSFFGGLEGVSDDDYDPVIDTFRKEVRQNTFKN